MSSTLMNDLLLYVAVIKNNSFTAAAKELGLTKSVISKRISRLENSLHVQLITRSTRKLTPTEEGNELYQRALRIKSALEEAEMAVTAANKEPHGLLRINSPLSFGHMHLAPAIAAFMQKYPKMQVEMLLGPAYIDIYDLGLDAVIRIGELPDSNLVARKLTTHRMRVCAAPSYLKKNGTPVHPDQLVDYNCLRHHNSPTGNEWHFHDGKREYRVPATGTFTSSSSQALESAAVNGLGLIKLPGYLMVKDIKKGNLVSILEDYCALEHPIHIVFPQTNFMPSKLRTLIDFLVEWFASEEYGV